MINFKTRMPIPIIIGIAFGVFFTTSCAQFNGAGSSDETVISNSSEAVSQRLARVNELLNENPSSKELQNEKADLLFTISQNTPSPIQRRPYYQNLKDLTESNQISGAAPNDHVESVVTRAWSSEQGQGITLLQEYRNNISPTAASAETITVHLENALILRPDSLSTYNTLANTYYLTGDLSSAIGTLIKAEEYDRSGKPDLREKLAYLYLESGNIGQSIDIYRSLASTYPDDDYLKHGLANALILNNEHPEAITILRSLVNDYSTRSEYREALATQLFFLFQTETDSILQDKNDDSLLSMNELTRIVDYISEIDQLLTELQNNVPFSDDELFRSALIYRNSADQLFSLSKFSNEESIETLEGLQIEYLQKTIPILEKLVENHPENREYIRSLYNVYLDLGMQEEADAFGRSKNL